MTQHPKRTLNGIKPRKDIGFLGGKLVYANDIYNRIRGNRRTRRIQSTGLKKRKRITFSKKNNFVHDTKN